jgi:hypothetical protein
MAPNQTVAWLKLRFRRLCVGTRPYGIQPAEGHGAGRGAKSTGSPAIGDLLGVGDLDENLLALQL